MRPAWRNVALHAAVCMVLAGCTSGSAGAGDQASLESLWRDLTAWFGDAVGADGTHGPVAAGTAENDVALWASRANEPVLAGPGVVGTGPVSLEPVSAVRRAEGGRRLRMGGLDCGAAAANAPAVERVLEPVRDVPGGRALALLRAELAEGVVVPPVEVGAADLDAVYARIAEAAGLEYAPAAAVRSELQTFRVGRRIRVAGEAEAVLEAVRGEARRPRGGWASWALVSGGRVVVREALDFRVRGAGRADALVAVSALQRAGAKIGSARHRAGAWEVDFSADAQAFGLGEAALRDARGGEAAWVDLWTAVAPSDGSILSAPPAWRDADFAGRPEGGAWMRFGFGEVGEALRWAREAGAVFGEGRVAAWVGDADARVDSFDCSGWGASGALLLAGSATGVDAVPEDAGWPFGRQEIMGRGATVFVWGESDSRKIAVARARVVRGIGEWWQWR